MDLLVTILIGVGVGAMVELLLPGHNIQELLLAMLLGIAGALVSEFIGLWADLYGAGDPKAYLVSLLGAIATLVSYGVFFREKSRA